MSDDIRRALLNQILEFDSGASDLALIDMILERFMVVPRDQVTTEYGVLYSSGENHRAIDRDNAATIVRGDRKHPGFVRDYDPKLASRLVLPWTVIPLPEEYT